MFFWTDIQLVNVSKTSPLTKQPMKKDANKLMIMEDLYCKSHYEITEDSKGKSHAYELLGRSHMLLKL